MTQVKPSRLDRQPWMVVAALFAVIAASAGALGISWKKEGAHVAEKERLITKAYFYDTQSNELMVMPIGTQAPTARPGSGADAKKTCVWAYLFSCGDCSQEEKRFIGFLLQLSPEYQGGPGLSHMARFGAVRMPGAVIQDFALPPIPMVPVVNARGSGTKVFRIADEEDLMEGGEIPWREFGLEETIREVEKLQAKCRGGKVRACHPE